MIFICLGLTLDRKNFVVIFFTLVVLVLDNIILIYEKFVYVKFYVFCNMYIGICIVIENICKIRIYLNKKF